MRKIGKFQIVRPLAPESAARLFEARDSAGGRFLALLLPRLRAGAAQAVPFLDGAPRVVALSHPNIARSYDLGIEGDVPYVVMEPVDGTPLDLLAGGAPARRLPARRPHPSPSAPWKMHVLRQTCDAVAHAHREGVLHLDLRPAHVMVTPSGIVKVLGFGVASLSAGDGALPDPRYAAPELCDRKPADGRADVFSLGALAHELVAGQTFARGNATPLAETEFSPRLEAIVARALAEDPDARPQSLAEMQKSLRQLAHNSAEAFFERMLGHDTPSPAAACPRPVGVPDRVQALYGVALSQAAAGHLQEASKLAQAIRRLAPDDPRNDEMRAYLFAEAESAVKAALASASGPRARALRQRLESLESRARRGRETPRVRPA